MKEDTIIYPSSMSLSLWLLAFIMTLAVYIPKIHLDHQQQESASEAAVLDQFKMFPLTDFALAVLNNVETSSPLLTNAVENHFDIEMSERPANNSKMVNANLSAQNNDLAPYRYVKKSERLYQPIILRAANRYEVDPAIVKAIILAESSYNPKAVSKSGAKGLMQLMPKTAREMGVKDIFNPEHNINGGVRYYKKLLNQFNGDVKLALAAYNAGLRKVREHNGVPPYKATRYYIQKVFEYYQHYKKQMEMNQA